MAGSSEDDDPPQTAPDLAIIGDSVTIHPGGYVEPLQSHLAPALPSENNVITTYSETESPLLDPMSRFRKSPFDFLREVSLYMSGTGWRAYDNVIGQPVFHKGFTERMKSMVLNSKILQQKIEELANRRVQEEERMELLAANAKEPGSRTESTDQKKNRRKGELVGELKDVADEMVDNMICKMESKHFIRGAYYLATQLLTRAYHQGIHVSSEEVMRLRRVATYAAEKKRSIIFLPCHKSHVDYVSLQLICYRLGIALPTVVAGDNLNIPALGAFLQHAGAMWIRRSFAGDALYTTTVQAYIDTLIGNGYHFECFIEGGRSRTGKLLPPKFGILNFLMDAVISGRTEDAIIMPVSTQYDKVIETESYVNELLGRPKKAENIVDFVNSSSVLNLKLGRVDVRFHEPWSLKNFIEEQMARLAKIPRAIGDASQDASSEARIRVLRTMGYKVLSDINAVSVVMPTALVGTVLLTLRGRGIGQSELIRRVEWVSDRVRAKGGRVAHFYGAPTSVVVDRAIEVLGSELVGTIEGLAEETFYAADPIQLSFYRNMTIHLFISEALVCASMYTKIKQGGGPETQRISYQELEDQVSFLSQIFAGEFIYETKGLKSNLHHTLEELEANGVIATARSGGGTHTSVELSPQERVRGRENYDFYCFMIWTFIESFWLAAVSLFSLTAPPNQTKEHDIWYNLSDVQSTTQLFGKTLYHQGDLSYLIAVNKETLKNAYDKFVVEGIIIIAKSKDKRAPASTVRLTREWMPGRDRDGMIKQEGRLWSFTEMIAKSRLEGKNRRDGPTVSTRVLKLADQLGNELYARAVDEKIGVAREEVERVIGRKKRRGGARRQTRL